MNIKTSVDQLGDQINFQNPPQRIISLVPSQTELLYDLGLRDEVIGITKFCVHPSAWLTQKKVIGGTKNFMFDVIDQLQPDLIIGNKEENYQEGIIALKKKYPVWMSDIISFEDALKMITAVGELTGKMTAAQNIVEHINSSFENLIKIERKKVLYLIWKKPWMAAGNETFINTLLTKLGFENCLSDTNRYPILSTETIGALKPDLILLSSEPFPFKEQQIQELKSISPSSEVMLVDGEMFSWYGSRLVHAPGYFNETFINR